MVEETLAAAAEKPAVDEAVVENTSEAPINVLLGKPAEAATPEAKPTGKVEETAAVEAAPTDGKFFVEFTPEAPASAEIRVNTTSAIATAAAEITLAEEMGVDIAAAGTLGGAVGFTTSILVFAQHLAEEISGLAGKVTIVVAVGTLWLFSSLLFSSFQDKCWLELQGGSAVEIRNFNFLKKIKKKNSIRQVRGEP